MASLTPRKDRPAESLRDYVMKQDLTRRLSRALEQFHSTYSGSLAYLAAHGGFPRVHASVASMPLDIMCATMNAMTTENYAAALMKKSATMTSSKTALITQSAHDALNCPDARLLAMLMKGEVTFSCPWSDVFYGTLPFAAWGAMVAKSFFVGEIAPQFLDYVVELQRQTMVSESGSPEVQPIYLLTRQFLSTASALEIEFSVKTVFTILVSKIEEVGAHHSSTWDPFYLKALVARREIEHDEEYPMDVLVTLVNDLGEYAAAEALLRSLQSATTSAPRKPAKVYSARAESSGDPEAAVVETEGGSSDVLAIRRYVAPPNCP